MDRLAPDAFHFGIEAEFLLADAHTFRPLWHPDLRFSLLNELLEAIPHDDLPSLAGLDLEPPHRRLMPYVVEGYHVPAPDLSPVDILPKGIEIRTPVCRSIEEALHCLQVLHGRLQAALGSVGYCAVSLSHHPIEHHFSGPQNKRRHDFWQWAMEVMLTCGPDINLSLPAALNERLDLAELDAKVNYYGPAMAALSLASPLYRGGLWTIRGRVGKSIRTYRRSTVAPAIEIHPEENGRLEFKLFEATDRLADYHAFFLLWLALVLDDQLPGRASHTSRIYDLGAVARFGLEAETVHDRAQRLIHRAADVLPGYGFAPQPLAVMQARLDTRRLPSDEIIDQFQQHGSVAAVLRERAGLR